MRKLLVTFVLALTGVMMAQAGAQQPADSQANVPANQKVIKDPAEYNAYITALNTQDPAQRGAAMDAFVKQYPQSIVRVDALEQAMAAYQQAGNQQKVQDTASQILQSNPNNVRALAVMVFLERQGIKDAATGAKARADAERGLQELPNWKKPEGVSDGDFEKMRTQMTGIFAGTAAFGALQQQDYAAASKFYEQALKVDPSDLANNYQMAISLLQANPMNPLGFWYGAKALSLAQTANPQAFQAWSPYFTSRYKRYHGNTDDWNKRVATAATQTAPPADFVASIPLAPTPCDLAAQAVQQNGPNDLSFSDWELVLACRDKGPANKAAAEQVWQAVQTKEKGGEVKLKIPTKVIAVPDDNTLELAVSEDNQAANKADMKVTMEKPMTKAPAPGASLDIIGVISEYTPDPFMFTMTKGELPAPAKPPAKKPPARRPGATKKK
jgi:tetratricopeptide (TPR) repeat protein